MALGQCYETNTRRDESDFGWLSETETAAFAPSSGIPSSTTGIDRILHPAFSANAPLTVAYNDEPGGLFIRVMLERPPNEPLLPPVLRAPSARALERRGIPASTARSMLDSIYAAQVDRSAAIASLLEAQRSYYDMVNDLESSGHAQALLHIHDSEFGPYSTSEVARGDAAASTAMADDSRPLLKKCVYIFVMPDQCSHPHDTRPTLWDQRQA